MESSNPKVDDLAEGPATSLQDEVDVKFKG